VFKTVFNTALNSPAKKILAGAIVVCAIGIIRQQKNDVEPGTAKDPKSRAAEKKVRSALGKGNVDAAFWKRIKKLLGKVLTSWTGKEAQLIYILTILLVVRTFMSIWLADVNGRVVKAIVNKSFTEFL